MSYSQLLAGRLLKLLSVLYGPWPWMYVMVFNFVDKEIQIYNYSQATLQLINIPQIQHTKIYGEET